MKNLTVYTIGVYNSTEDTYFQKLLDNKVQLFCDIRMRRGVRGSQYKYVNSKYLQAKLAELGIAYKYIKELAPTKDIRQKQKDADKLNGKTKKQRTTLGCVFASEYERQILSHYNLNALVEELQKQHIERIALFCVEEHAAACHRSLVAAALEKITNCITINL